MCKPASMIICDKGRRVVWSKHTDSHEQIISEFKLTEGAGRVNFVRVEISPANGDITTPLNDWRFETDQGADTLPDWYDAAEAEKIVRVALKEWAAQKLIVGKVAELRDGQFYICGSATVESIGDGATVKYICDSATVKYICDSATVESIGGSATVKYIGGSATVEAIGGSATVEAIGGSATVKSVCDSATVKYIGGSATVKSVGGRATVEYIGGSATVESIGGGATVTVYKSMDPSCLKSETCVLIDRKQATVRVYVGDGRKLE